VDSRLLITQAKAAQLRSALLVTGDALIQLAGIGDDQRANAD
jgi:hypothetical protein